MSTINPSANFNKYICIYCLKEKDKKCFNTEHVIPRSFGLYGTETMTLINKVCAECNTLFGNTIDIVLGRDTIEGVQRFKYGLKDKKKSKSKKPQHPQYGKDQIRTITEGELKGLQCKLEFLEQENKLTLLPLKDDIGFRRKDGLYDFYPKEDMPARAESENNYPVHPDRLIILNPQEEDIIRKSLVEKFGEKIQYKVYSDNSERGCTAEFQCSTVEYFRPYAKIALNYFAYFNTPEILLQKCFDPIRNFILNRDIPHYKAWEICQNTILPETDKAISAHIVHVEFSYDQSLIVSIGLNNSKPHYKICLAPNYSGLPIKTDYGHVFDFPNHKIHRLNKSSIVLPYNLSSIIMPIKPKLYI